MNDSRPQREQMVGTQIEARGVRDAGVLAAMREVPREVFVPAELAEFAYRDSPLPIECGQTISQPYIVALMAAALRLAPGDRVLEIGTGSGYMTALLARLATQVLSVEIVPEFSRAAAARLAENGFRNVTLEIGDGALGWARSAPFDAILVTGSLPMLPEEFPAQLAPGGRMIAVVGRAPIMTAQLVTCLAPGKITTVGLFETSIPPLQHAREPERFVF